jgi:hypothetical protein
METILLTFLKGEKKRDYVSFLWNQLGGWDDT